MKFNTLLTIGLCVGLGSGLLSGRTWTSADGGKTFEGEFQSFDADTNKVTVTKNGRPMTFSIDIISENDQAWVKQQPSKQEIADFEESELGKSLTKAKIMEDNQYVDFSYEKPPKYFLLYYTASW